MTWRWIKKESGSMGTFFVSVILAAVVALAIRTMVRDKKQGRSLQCGCDCKNCSHHCGQ